MALQIPQIEPKGQGFSPYEPFIDHRLPQGGDTHFREVGINYQGVSTEEFMAEWSATDEDECINLEEGVWTEASVSTALP